VRRCTESEGELFYCFWSPLQKMSSTDGMPSYSQFFFVFVVWAAFFCLWTFSTLVALNVRATTRQGINVDPEQIATMVL
jgi:hypothetical protein